MDQSDRPGGAGTLLPGGEPLTPQLPSGRNRVERITEHGKGLISDLTSWAELKMKLVQVEIEEKIDTRVNKLVSTAIVAGIALLGVVFLLIALGVGAGALLIAIGLSEPLSYFLGFLTIALILFAAAGIIQSMKPHMVDVGRKEAEVEQSKLVPVLSSRDAPNRGSNGEDA
jgi:hypothetical protein